MDPAKWLVKAMLFYRLLQISFSIDSITPQSSLRDGDVVVSSGNKFALGFFSPANSSSRYVGIWYYQVSLQTVVWVANTENPINDTSGTLSINPQGNLVLYHQNQTTTLWSATSSVTNSNNSVARLLESGNLVLIQNDTTYWQSFDHPSSIVISSMKFGLNLTTGLNRFFTSWKSPDDPGIGTVTYKIDPTGFPQLCLFKGSVKIWRAGSWTGQRWVGVPLMSRDQDINNTFVYNNEEISFVFKVRSGLSVIPIFKISEVGLMQMLSWDPQGLRWIEIWSAPTDQCDYYGYCGPNSNCDQTLARNESCDCLPGFEPKSPETWTWAIRKWTAGCVRKPNVSICQHGEGFVKMVGVKIPDTATAIADMSLGLKQCRQKCLTNCSCMAYASAYFEAGGGTGCLTWYGDLMDIRSYTGAGQDLFLRVDAVTLASYRKNGLTKKQRAAIVSVSVGVMLSMVAFAFCLVKRRRRGRRRGIPLITESSTHFDDSLKETGAELPMFDLETIAASTNNFSSDNRLGQGGFGPVYKGTLNGKEVAVKRLSKSSTQGIEEFKNEVTLIAKLQHRNLVRILGCCIEKEEKMLIYEYLPNKSLDCFIFDQGKKSLLDWRSRFEILSGIARGIVYLHQDSRLRIIHRDLKASNILLDADMNPKISDFGMARIFGGDQIEANTERVVGTYGYMSPEYAMEGHFSIKSDVYSFGVLLLEIVTGRRNSGHYPDSPTMNLIGHVWELWRNGKAMEIVDSSLGGAYPSAEVLRCIEIGLLCVQESVTDRPRMSAVVAMLGNDVALPSPAQPAYIVKKMDKEYETSSSTSQGTGSVNMVTLTMPHAR